MQLAQVVQGIAMSYFCGGGRADMSRQHIAQFFAYRCPVSRSCYSSDKRELRVLSLIIKMNCVSWELPPKTAVMRLIGRFCGAAQKMGT